MSQQEVQAKLERWASAFADLTTANICALYDDNASLWGTVSSRKRDSPELIKDYFSQIFTFEDRQVQINSSDIRIFGNVAICNGLYTLHWNKDGKTLTTSARFSIVYRKQNRGWLIVEHHSSAVPTEL
ncbi:SgcJ/EcaC family oxidoreductase [Alginatibacterium sediminis]|uniref:SgcJ/EcaC family oxidoreductase n=1 Tax=Alginatibacterium sediminis TaxID=2164068 RepID=A0A420EHX8_9ALTE|nr:SgcJ/EcaC family oxidoreductase [Alginatibacterium sediminis]RKF20322.1 SgcJ/EcaC family oxidoreductase [Alginatibacterium sediminis]